MNDKTRIAGVADQRQRHALHMSRLRGLTFELSRERRCGAWPARRMMTVSASRAKCHAGASRLQRRVRPQELRANRSIGAPARTPRTRCPRVLRLLAVLWLSKVHCLLPYRAARAPGQCDVPRGAQLKEQDDHSLCVVRKVLRRNQCARRSAPRTACQCCAVGVRHQRAFLSRR